eukprot:g20397.t1
MVIVRTRALLLAGWACFAALLAAAKKLLKKEKKKKKKKETNGGGKTDKNKQKRKELEAAAKASATAMKSKAKATPPTKIKGMPKVVADATNSSKTSRTGARKSATVVRSIFDAPAPSSGARIAGKTTVASAGGSGIFAARGSGGHPSIVGPLTKMAMDPTINRKMSDWRDLTGPGARLTEADLDDADRDRADAPFLFEPGPKRCLDRRTGQIGVLDADAAQAAWLKNKEVEIISSQVDELDDLGGGGGMGASLAFGGAAAGESVVLGGGAAGIVEAEALDEDAGAGGGDENAAGAADGDIGIAGAGGDARGASTGDVGAGVAGGGGTEAWADGDAADVSCLACPILGAGADSAAGQADDSIDPETMWLLTAYAGQGGLEEAAQVLKVVEEERPASYGRLLLYGQSAGREDLDWLRWAPVFADDGKIINVGLGCWVCKAHGKPDAGKKTAQSSYIVGNVLLEREMEKSSKEGATYIVDVPRNGTAVSQVLVHAKTNAHQFAATAHNRLYRSGLIDAAGASTVKEIKKGPQYGAVDLWRPPRALFDVTQTLIHHCWISIYKNETQEGWSLHAEVTLAKMQGGDKGSTSAHSFQEYAAALKKPMQDAKPPLTNLAVNLTSTHPKRQDDMLAVLTEAYGGLVDAFTVPGRRPQEVVELCIEYDVKSPTNQKKKLQLDEDMEVDEE